MRPFRFFADAAVSVVDGRELAERARRAEAMGYSGLIMPDHLVEQLAPLPTLTTVAAATERLRLLPFVLNNDLRHPAVVAQDLATIDVLSGGRLEVGLGGGWNAPEFRAIGIPFDPVGTRVARLAEAVAVLKGCFADGPFSFAGEHYTVSDHDGQPKPAQRPAPPLFIGGGGRRTLTLAAREADTVGLAPRLTWPGGEPRGDPRSITAAATEEKIGWVREAAGERFERLELNVYPSMSAIVVTDHARAEAAKVVDRLRDRTGVELTEDEVLGSPHIYIGSIAGLTAKFVELRERFGISSILTGDIDELPAVVERLAGT
jgi:probable F420-dependent oxidoreductase